MTREQDDAGTERGDLDAETLFDDAQELFGADDESEPVAEADAPPPG